MPKEMISSILPLEVLKCEHSAAQYLQGLQEFRSDTKYSKFSYLLNNWGSKVRVSMELCKKKSCKNYEYAPEVVIPVFLDGDWRDVYCNFLMSVNQSRFSQWTCGLAVVNANKFIIRKFHFDSVFSAVKTPHPYVHLQYGGRLSELMNSDQLKPDRYNPKLDRPRLPFYPMTLGMLLNLLFMEDENRAYDAILKGTEWRNIMHAYEKIILGPCFNKLYSFISDHSKNRAPLMIEGYYAHS